jgi:hypothetical protein
MGHVDTVELNPKPKSLTHHVRLSSFPLSIARARRNPARTPPPPARRLEYSAVRSHSTLAQLRAAPASIGG